MNKKCGVLLPIFSLPSKYGIGTLGEWAYKFIDLLKQTNHTYWQILPIAQTGFGDSPYSSCADLSGNPYFIDPEFLRDEHLLTYRETLNLANKTQKINYGKLYEERIAVFRVAFARFDQKNVLFKSFLKKGEYRDYALYMALKNVFCAPWYEWQDKFKFRDKVALDEFEKANRQEVLFWQFLQFEFWQQYFKLKKYATKNGIKIIGDLPLYVAYDSVDCWVNPSQFMFDENYNPTDVAGVPPDYFSKTGQLWGNPIYNYDKMRQDGFAFWKKRVAHSRKIYDLVRIDHFRGIDRFWAIPFGDLTAENGRWREAPKMDLLNAVGTENLIAEDLGLIDESVKSLLNESKMPGLKVLLFAFGDNDKNPYLPWNIEENSITYTGTHDNNTIVGSLKSLDKEQLSNLQKMVKKVLDYCKIYKNPTGVLNTSDAIVDIAYATNSKLVIVPMQDVLGLGEEFRINTPGTENCWTVQLRESQIFTPNVINAMKRRAKRFNRA